MRARGTYEFSISGRRVGEAHLTPGWSSYQHRLRYQIYDVTSMLESGRNTAASYGNEEAVGRGIAASGVPREELFVTSKLWIQRRGAEGAREAIRTSLQKLCLATSTCN